MGAYYAHSERMKKRYNLTLEPGLMDRAKCEADACGLSLSAYVSFSVSLALRAKVTIPGRERLKKEAGGVAVRVPSRNAPCPCGSGKKYKRCCGAPCGKGGPSPIGNNDRNEGKDREKSRGVLLQQ